MGLKTNPPQPGDESYELYRSERDAIHDSLKRRATKLVAALNIVSTLILMVSDKFKEIGTLTAA